MSKPLPRWPLILIAAPAAVSIWGGWVGLGALAGFGPVHLLPGILPRFTVNTAITLPVGVEAYAAYALGAWLRPGTPDAARRFARWSAVCALLLGMAGQVAYHLLAAWHARQAPWPVIVAVSCILVIALGFGAALHHLITAGGEAGSQQPQRHEWAELAAPVAAAVAARIAPSRGSARGTPDGTSDGSAQVTADDTAGVTVQDTPAAPVRVTRKAPVDRSEWPSARGTDNAELLRLTRAEVRKWERGHEPGDRLPAVQLGDRLKLRMSRETAGKLLAEVYRPHLVAKAE